MSSSFGGAALQIPLENGPRAARTATGATVTVTHKTVPIEVSVRTPWGAVNVPPITFAVMPGSDDLVLFDVATMKEFGLDLFPWALENLCRADRRGESQFSCCASGDPLRSIFPK